MSKFNFAAVIFAAGIAVIFVSCRAAVPIKGDGIMVTSEKSIAPFENMEISGDALVYFHPDREYRAVVTVDSNLEDYVEVFTKNKTLHIGSKKRGSYLFTQFIVDVYCPGLAGVSISGSARFEGKNTITVPRFRSQISGTGKIEGNFECDDFSTAISGSGEIAGYIACSRFRADISGSGKIAVNGNSNDTNITVSGSGVFTGNEFKTNNANIRISGSGNMHIWVVENLKANVSGFGTIKYRGNPKIDFKGSGSGRLESD